MIFGISIAGITSGFYYSIMMNKIVSVNFKIEKTFGYTINDYTTKYRNIFVKGLKIEMFMFEHIVYEKIYGILSRNLCINLTDTKSIKDMIDTEFYLNQYSYIMITSEYNSLVYENADIKGCSKTYLTNMVFLIVLTLKYEINSVNYTFSCTFDGTKYFLDSYKNGNILCKNDFDNAKIFSTYKNEIKLTQINVNQNKEPIKLYVKLNGIEEILGEYNII